MRSPETPRQPLFRAPPFPAFPSVDRYVPVGTLKDSLNRVVRSIESREGLSLVIGPPGTGKSLLTQLLAKHFTGSRSVVQLGDSALKQPDAFHRHLLHHLGVVLNHIEGGDLHLALVDHVKRTALGDAGLLVLIDEAQALSEDVLEAVRMATNIMIDGQPRVCAVLCGGPKLDETLAMPSMEPLTQRVATRCYLHPMNAVEAREFISRAIRNGGGELEQTITDDAISAVFHAAAGVPRLINQLMTQAIDSAEQMRQTLIDGRVIDVAWATLQQLPSPMIDEPDFAGAAEPVADGVEFGSLSDWDADSDDAACDGVEANDAEARRSREDEQLAAPETAELIADDETPGIQIGGEAELDLETRRETESDATPSAGCDDCSGGSCHADRDDAAEDQFTATALQHLSGDASMDEEVLSLAETTNASGPIHQEVMNTTSSIVTGAVVTDNLLTDEALGNSDAVVDVVGRCDMDLSIEPDVQPTAYGPQLFGEFDVEEDLAVGLPTGGSRESAVTKPVDDVEWSIQRDVAEIADDVVQAKISDGPGVEADDIEASIGEVDNDETDNDEASLRLASEDEEPGFQDPKSGESKSEESVLWICEDSQGNLVRDDSDLLVVEDDVPGEVPPPAPSAMSSMQRSDGETVSVDFQAMLAKMRGDA